MCMLVHKCTSAVSAGLVSDSDSAAGGGVVCVEPPSRGVRKASGGGERNDENTGQRQSPHETQRTKHSRITGQRLLNSAAKPLGKISGKRLCRTKTKYHQHNKQVKH